MNEVILFVFEGEKLEREIFKNLVEPYFSKTNKLRIQTVFCTDIYQLWQLLNDDEFLDLSEMLKERNPENAKALEGIERDQIYQTFLFFDYDGHATKASDERFKKMLFHFDNETELNKGKIYASYPMSESIKESLDQDFKNRTRPIKEGRKYKSYIDETTPFKNRIDKISDSDWKLICRAHLKKSRFLVTNHFDFEGDLPDQIDIFSKQQAKHIKPHGTVSVLSAFPCFLEDYFGSNFLS